MRTWPVATSSRVPASLSQSMSWSENFPKTYKTLRIATPFDQVLPCTKWPEPDQCAKVGALVLTRPKIRSSVRLYTVSDKVVVGRDEREDVVIENPVFARLAPLCDGQRTLSEIMAELGASFSPPQIFFALDQLEKRGLAVEGDGARERVDLGFIERFDARPAEAAKRLDAFSVSLRRFGDLPEVPLAEMIRANGLRVVEDAADLTVVVARDYL